MPDDEILEDDADGDYNYEDGYDDQEVSESTSFGVGEEGGALIAQACKDGDDEYLHEDSVPHSDPCKLCQCLSPFRNSATKTGDLKTEIGHFTEIKLYRVFF